MLLLDKAGAKDDRLPLAGACEPRLLPKLLTSTDPRRASGVMPLTLFWIGGGAFAGSGGPFPGWLTGGVAGGLEA